MCFVYMPGRWILFRTLRTVKQYSSGLLFGPSIKKGATLLPATPSAIRRAITWSFAKRGSACDVLWDWKLGTMPG
jgi:hypothetical protein